ncbi:hypothetical protein RP300_00512 [Oligella urethralis]|uniref:DciA family protein n=1 Tax=Oligella TaxID=90243 RepID=UPI0008A4B288|nr:MULTISPECIES: DciA family protein [Oligella]OFS83956.1 hypothetical protein HMPREF3144_08045 [Oligella sp. HMSC05A10]OFV49145.1 hypothetical protein HMPREF3179_04560 [Oligella sp. HMSC09E12]WOS36976.1 hypothetical protein RP300_00512 [Oligella urethralis]SUA59498.1 Protein of uncharacterised function (DUF721) [Oligella urethralis]
MKSHRNYRQPPNFHTAIEWLEQEQATGEVLQRARTILKLQPLLVSVLGTELTKQCLIINYTGGTLRLAVANNACAAKIKQLAPSMMRHLNKHGLALQNVELKVIRSTT